MLSIYRAGEIDLFENLDIVHIRLLVEVVAPGHTWEVYEDGRASMGVVSKNKLPCYVGPQ